MLNAWRGTLLIVFILIFDQLIKGYIQSTVALGKTKALFDGVFLSNIPKYQFLGMNLKNSWQMFFSVFLLIALLGVLIYLMKKTNKLRFCGYLFIFIGVFNRLIDLWLLKGNLEYFNIALGMFRTQVNLGTFLEFVGIMLLLFSRIVGDKLNVARST